MLWEPSRLEPPAHHSMLSAITPTSASPDAPAFITAVRERVAQPQLPVLESHRTPGRLSSARRTVEALVPTRSSLVFQAEWIPSQSMFISFLDRASPFRADGMSPS